MKVELIKTLGDWKDVRNLARATVGKDEVDTEVSGDFRIRILGAEHSPIRVLQYIIKMSGIPYWVSVHLVRHKIGIEHFVKTQRTDRTGIERGSLPQDTPVDHTILVNAQALIQISRKRLCMHASPETRAVWQAVIDEVGKVDPFVKSYCVPECEYRGGNCSEIGSCGKCS